MKFCTLELHGASTQQMVTHVQVLRGSRFADSWDGIGRRWLYLLPRPTAIERTVHHLLWLRELPLSVAQLIWRMAASWPLAAPASPRGRAWQYGSYTPEPKPEPEPEPEPATRAHPITLVRTKSGQLGTAAARAVLERQRSTR